MSMILMNAHLKTMVGKNHVSKFQFNEKREALKYAAKEQLMR